MSLDLLSILDAGESLTLPERAVLLAEHAPGADRLPTEPIGRTSLRLLALCEQLGGRALDGTATCWSCGVVIEFSVDAAKLADIAPSDDAAWDPIDGVRWRPVSFEDLVIAALAPDEDAAVDALLSRCVEGEVDGKLRALLVDAMEQADPLAEVELDLRCPECDETVRALLDVVDFTWARVDAEARNLLYEIDVLARAYSWSAADIVALPAPRRRRFVDLATGGER